MGIDIDREKGTKEGDERTQIVSKQGHLTEKQPFAGMCEQMQLFAL